MEKLLKIKHWQIFIYLVILPALFPEGDIEIYLMCIWGLLFALWVVKVDEALYHRLPNGVHLSFNFLLINILVSGAYLAVIFLTVGGYNITEDTYAEYGWRAWIYIPMHFYTFFSLFYIIRFTAKAIASIENKRNIGIAGYGTYMAALFFFPIGIWWMQPKINKILAGEKELPATND